jgi:phage/plasmid-associated DNA primase
MKTLNCAGCYRKQQKRCIMYSEECICSKCIIVVTCNKICYKRYLQWCKDFGYERRSEKFFIDKIQQCF